MKENPFFQIIFNEVLIMNDISADGKANVNS